MFSPFSLKKENREYWNNFEMDSFKRLLADYDDIIASFNISVGYFEQGLPLIAPADIRLDIRELKGSYFTNNFEFSGKAKAGSHCLFLQ